MVSRGPVARAGNTWPSFTSGVDISVVDLAFEMVPIGLDGIGLM